MKTLALLIVLPFASRGATEAVSLNTNPNWTGKYSPCFRHSDLLNPGHIDLAVRLSTANPLLAEQFAKALDFWTGVLDLEWHEVEAGDCAVQLVDGTPSLFNFCMCMSARSQLPDRPGFQGWIAFNSRMKLSKQQMFIDSVHEIGHLLGLPHNPSESSVMYYFGTGNTLLLDAVDLDTLAARHQLRPYLTVRTGEARDVRVIAHAGEPRRAIASSAPGRTNQK